ncbi:MAG: type II toxin-antitoxin system YafQ family toxin [Muribaculaceae bacterium]|nr:type II toxin-antitoxin system YafQ family toxin [Muribaculaceae bacterium]
MCLIPNTTKALSFIVSFVTFEYAWECHIEPDWLLVWEQNDMELILLLIDTGSHSDLF